MQREFAKYHYRRRKTQLLVCAILFLSTLTAYYFLPDRLELLSKSMDFQAVCVIAYVFIGLVGCFWVYLDGIEHEESGRWFWALAVFFAAPLTLPAYLLIKRGLQAYKEFSGIILMVFCICVLSYGAITIYMNPGFFKKVWEFVQPTERQEINL